MGWLRRRSAAELIGARALVVPFDAQATEGNTSSVSAGQRVQTQMRLVLRSAEDGNPTPDGQQTVKARIPNWMRVVLYYAGSNEGPWEQLPAEVDIPVRIDPTSRAIVDVDVDRAAAELEPHRDVATRWWKEDEGPLADVRGAIAAPGAAVEGAKGLMGAWRGALSDLREDRKAGGATQRTQDPAEAEQRRRTATALKFKLERDPKQLAKVRASALQAGPMMADNVRSGASTASEFESWLELQVTSGAISDAEAGEFRRRSGAITDAAGSPPDQTG